MMCNAKFVATFASLLASASAGPSVQLDNGLTVQGRIAPDAPKVAEFLGIPVDETRLPLILHHCSFDYMKAHAHLSAPLGGTIWKGGASTFINKGTNGRWQRALSPADVAAYEARAIRELGHHCAHWLATGDGL